VTIVVPRRAAEDFYYAIAMALGGRAGFGGGYFAEWAPGKKGMGPGMTPKGKGTGYDDPMSCGKSSGPKPKV
jgi:hypothetical protein